jgi:hypothetical protein
VTCGGNPWKRFNEGERIFPLQCGKGDFKQNNNIIIMIHDQPSPTSLGIPAACKQEDFWRFGVFFSLVNHLAQGLVTLMCAIP